MTRHEEMKLMTVLREIVNKLMSSGSTTTGSIYEALILDYPEICEKNKESLFRAQIANLSRRVMKRAADTSGSAQLVLPLKLRSLKGQVTSHICLPPALLTEEGHEPDPDADFIWLPTEEATFTQVGLYLEHLRSSIAADQKKYKVMNRIYQFLRPHMDNDEHRHESIGPTLAEIVAAENDKRR